MMWRVQARSDFHGHNYGNNYGNKLHKLGFTLFNYSYYGYYGDVWPTLGGTAAPSRGHGHTKLFTRDHLKGWILCLLLQPSVKLSFNGCMFGENPIPLISEHAISLQLPIVHLSTDCIRLVMYAHTHLYIYIFFFGFAQQWVIPFEFCIPQNSHFTGGRDDKPLDFGVTNFETQDGTQHLAQIHSRCAGCTHASMCDLTGSAFSCAPHSFWRACHLLHSKHSRQSKVSDPFAARREYEFRFWCRPRHETERYPISEAMATVERHNRSADVASPGCLAGYQKFRTEITTFSPSAAPFRLFGFWGAWDRLQRGAGSSCATHVCATAQRIQWPGSQENPVPRLIFTIVHCNLNWAFVPWAQGSPTPTL